MTILDKITADKRRQVALDKQRTSTAELEGSPHFGRERRSLAASIRRPDRSGIIAEFKRYSPSKLWIREGAEVAEVVPFYAQYGAAGVSVLTDQPYFRGSSEDLRTARGLVDIPLLRKEFIVDEYQIVEAAALGADAILLICECLTKAEIRSFARVARSLGLEVLLELHDRTQLDKYTPDVQLIGVNNRDLKTFTVDFDRSVAMLPELPTEAVRVAESGLSDPAVVRRLRDAGFEGFLMGEHFMRQPDPGLALRDFYARMHD